jgi:AraC-like DNA-binding protein
LDKSDRWAAFGSPPDSIRRYSICALGAGAQSGRLRIFRGRSLPSHGLVIISSGRGSYVDATGTEHPVRAPVLIWLFPGVEHGYGPDHDGWSERWVLFGGVGAQLYEELGLIARTEPVTAVRSIPADLDALMEQLRAALETLSIHDQLRASIAVQRVLALAIGASIDPSGRPDGDPVLRAFGRTAQLPLSMAERAQRLGMTTRALREAIRAATGLTPQSYLIELRVSRARSLLAESKLDVNVVAAQTGFDDPAYFSRTFTRRVGVSPRAFRQQQG